MESYVRYCNKIPYDLRRIFIGSKEPEENEEASKPSDDAPHDDSSVSDKNNAYDDYNDNDNNNAYDKDNNAYDQDNNNAYDDNNGAYDVLDDEDYDYDYDYDDPDTDDYDIYDELNLPGYVDDYLDDYWEEICANREPFSRDYDDGSAPDEVLEAKRLTLEKRLQDKFGEFAISGVEAIKGERLICPESADDIGECYVIVEIKLRHLLEKTDELEAFVQEAAADIFYGGEDSGFIIEDPDCGFFETIPIHYPRYGRFINEYRYHSNHARGRTGEWTDEGRTGERTEEESDPEEILDAIIGLESAKEQLRSIVSVAKGRVRRGAGSSAVKNVFTFEGNPGCGKTKFARVAADYLAKTGVVKSKAPFHDVRIASVIGRYVGDTEANVKKLFAEGKGSVIFLDEAYSIADVPYYGINAINSMIKQISDMTSDTVLIMAGYPGRMTEFLKTNPGLESRVSERIHFDDYSLDELLDILRKNLDMEYKIRYAPEDAEKIRSTFGDMLRAVSFNTDENCGRSIGNARAIDNLIKKIEAYQTADYEEKVKTNENADPCELTLDVAKKAAAEAIEQSKATGTALGAVQPPYLAVPADLEGVTFDKIIGNKDAIETLKKQAEIMKNYGTNNDDDAFLNAGGGLFLSGYPGCGKTMMARAFANEAAKDGSKAAFITPDINTLLTDHEAMGKLFDDIEVYDRCILFLDEVDSIGTERSSLTPSTPQYIALMTLLTKLDGFRKKGGLFVLSASNHPEMIDPAIRRRLGHEIRIEIPNEDERIELIKQIAEDKNVKLKINKEQLNKISEMLDGSSYADIVTVADSAFKNLTGAQLSAEALESAIKNYRYGHISNALIPEEERERIARHEMGHAVVQLMLDAGNKDAAVFMEHRTNGALGYTKLAKPQGNLRSRSQLLNLIKTYLGGKAAEEVFYGAMDVSNGCSEDLKQASDIAVDMLSRYGMGEMLLTRPQNDSEVLKEADKLLKECYSQVREMLMSSKDKLEKGARFLKDKDVLSNKKLREICGIG